MAAKITFENEKEFGKKLKEELPKAVRFATAFTLNDLAYSGVKKADREIRKSMTIRNKFTLGNKIGSKGIKYNKAIPHRNMSLQFSEFGATKDRDYLEDQEKGFKHKGLVPALKSRTSRNYHRTIKKINYISKMKIKRVSDYEGRGEGSTKRARAMLYLAYKESFGKTGTNQFFFFENNEYHGFKEGFFQFSGRPKGAYPNLVKIYHGKNTTDKTRKPIKWLTHSLEKFTQKEVDNTFEKNSIKQLKRFNLI